MMKRIVLGSAAIVSAVVFSGCQMCTAPIAGDPSCIEKTHTGGIDVAPRPVELVKPNFVPTRDVFRPTYRAGEKRVSAVGTGNTLDDATSDAYAKILIENKCDYLVSVTRIVTKKTHPAAFFRFFPVTNYTVTVAGLPVFLDKLVKEEMKELPPAPKQNQELKAVLKEVQSIKVDMKNLKTVKAESPVKCPPPLALVDLTDIHLNLTAKAATREPVAVGVPAPRCGAKAAKISTTETTTISIKK